MNSEVPDYYMNSEVPDYYPDLSSALERTISHCIFLVGHHEYREPDTSDLSTNAPAAQLDAALAGADGQRDLSSEPRKRCGRLIRPLDVID